MSNSESNPQLDSPPNPMPTQPEPEPELERGQLVQREQIVYMLMQDLSDPMKGLMGRLHRLRELLNAKRYGHVGGPLEVALESSQRLLHLIETFLGSTVQRNGLIALDITHCRMQELVQAALAACSEEELDAPEGIPGGSKQPVQVSNRIAANFPALPADRYLITQVLVNLIGLFMSYASAGDSVTFEAQQVSIDGLIYARIQATHSGQPVQNIVEMFDNPSLENYQGASISSPAFCRLIVESHGGMIQAQVTGVQTSVIAFTLPFVSLAVLRKSGERVL